MECLAQPLGGYVDFNAVTGHAKLTFGDAGVQDFSGQGQGNQSIWLLYQNEGLLQTYDFDCTDNTSALIAPFDEGITVKNLLYPYDELRLGKSPQMLSRLYRRATSNMVIDSTHRT